MRSIDITTHDNGLKARVLDGLTAMPQTSIQLAQELRQPLHKIVGCLVDLLESGKIVDTGESINDRTVWSAK